MLKYNNESVLHDSNSLTLCYIYVCNIWQIVARYVSGDALYMTHISKTVAQLRRYN